MNRERIYRLRQDRARTKPEWFNEAGLVVLVEESSTAERQGVVVLSNVIDGQDSLTFRLVITPAGWDEQYSQPTWRLNWRLSYETPGKTTVDIHVAMVLLDWHFRPAFVLPKGAKGSAAAGAGAKGAVCGGVYVRKGRYLNLPFQNLPSISIFVSEEIRRALYQLIAARKERELKG